MPRFKTIRTSRGLRRVKVLASGQYRFVKMKRKRRKKRRGVRRRVRRRRRKIRRTKRRTRKRRTRRSSYWW